MYRRPAGEIPHMDTLKLKYFKAVAQTEHMSRAAEKLHITQPALSKAIAQLEEELGYELFNRIGRQIKLNDKGKIFLKYAESALKSLDEAMRSLKESGDSRYGKIKFQTNVIADSYLVDLVLGFKAKYPHTRFDIIKNYTKSKFQNDCDIYIHAEKIVLYKCVSTPIFSEEIMLGVKKGHPLSAFDEISLTQAENEPFVSLMRSTSWSEETESFCHEAGFKPDIFYECDGIEMVAKLIAASACVGFLPAKSWGDFPEEVKLLHVTDVKCARNYNLSWYSDKEQSFLVSEFKKYTMDFFRDVTASRNRHPIKA